MKIRRLPFLRITKISSSLIAVGLLLLWPIITTNTAHANTRYETGISTNATLLRMSNVALDNRLKDIQSLGATWIRVDFSWAEIQPDNPTDYNWGMYDRIVRVAGIHHLKVLAVLDYTPRWARDPRCQALASSEELAQKCSPSSVDAFSRFARAAVIRYHTKSVRGWEIWNEPNLIAYWRTVEANNTIAVDPLAYARIANAAAAQIRRYTDAVIITGGLSPLFQPSHSTGMSQSDYLAQILPHLNPTLFNGIGIHPYTWPDLPSKVATYNAFYTVDHGPPQYNLRTIMNRAGWNNKQIWATEYGASTKGTSRLTYITTQSRPDHVTEATQAQIISQGIDEWYDKSNVGPLFVQSDSDQWLSTLKNEGGFGLRRSDGTKKPAYNAYQTATRQLGDRK